MLSFAVVLYWAHLMNVTVRKTIAVLEIVGGIAGLVNIVLLAVAGVYGPHITLSLAILVPLYLLVLIAGVLLWQGTRIGMQLSIVAQFFQLPKIVSPALIYLVSYGLDFSVSMERKANASGHIFNLQLLANPMLVFNPVTQFETVGISIVSLAALIALLMWKPAIVPIIPATKLTTPDVHSAPRENSSR